MIGRAAIYLWIGWGAVAFSIVLCAYGVRELRRWQRKIDPPEQAAARRRLREAMDAELRERADRDKRDYL